MLQKTSRLQGAPVTAAKSEASTLLTEVDAALSNNSQAIGRNGR